MNNLKNIAIMAIISLAFVAQTNAQKRESLYKKESERRHTLKGVEIDEYYDFKEFQLEERYQFLKDSLQAGYGKKELLSKEEVLRIENELANLQAEMDHFDRLKSTDSIESKEEMMVLVDRAKTREFLAISNDKVRISDAKTDAVVAQDQDKVSYYENKTSYRDAKGDLKTRIIPNAADVNTKPATRKAKKLAKEQVETMIADEKAQQKANKKYGPQSEEKPAEVEWNSTTEKKSTSTEVNQNVQIQQPVQTGQANNLPSIINGGTKVSTVRGNGRGNGIFSWNGRDCCYVGDILYYVGYDSLGAYAIMGNGIYRL